MATHEREENKPIAFNEALRQLIKAGHIKQERGKKSTSKAPAKKPAK